MQLREILQWLIKLLPKQKMQDNDGSGNLQAGRVEGDLHHSHTQAVYNIFMMAPDPAQTAVVSEPSTKAEDIPTVQITRLQSQQHSAVLARMGQLHYRSRITVLDFMDREFKTRMVIELQTEQLFRLNKYLDVVLSNPRALKRKQVA